MMKEDRMDVCRDCGAEFMNITGMVFACCPKGQARLVPRIARDE